MKSVIHIGYNENGIVGFGYTYEEETDKPAGGKKAHFTTEGFGIKKHKNIKPFVKPVEMINFLIGIEKIETLLNYLSHYDEVSLILDKHSLEAKVSKFIQEQIRLLTSAKAQKLNIGTHDIYRYLTSYTEGHIGTMLETLEKTTSIVNTITDDFTMSIISESLHILKRDSEVIVDSPVKKYFTPPRISIELLYGHNIYFTQFNLTHNGAIQYLGASHKVEEEIGRNANDVTYTVVHQKEPEPLVKELISYITPVLEDYDIVCVLKIPEFNSGVTPIIYNVFKEHAVNVTELDLHRRKASKVYIGSSTVVRVLFPQYLARVAMDKMSGYITLLDRFIKKTLPTTFEIHDITNLFFTDGVISKDITNKSFLKLLHVKVNKIPVIIGRDFIDRNSLNRLKNVKISLVTEDKEDYISYFYVIESEDGVALYNTFATNIKYKI
jgi:hypothetical protein